MPLLSATHARPVGGGIARSRVAYLAGAVALVLLLVVLASHAFDAPAHVARVTIANDSPFAIDVTATGDGSESWTSIGTAERGTSTTFEQVLDLGDSWIFRFRSQGVDGGQVRVSRAALRDADWLLAIPSSVIATLTTRGVTPTPAPET